MGGMRQLRIDEDMPSWAIKAPADAKPMGKTVGGAMATGAKKTKKLSVPRCAADSTRRSPLRALDENAVHTPQQEGEEDDGGGAREAELRRLRAQQRKKQDEINEKSLRIKTLTRQYNLVVDINRSLRGEMEMVRGEKSAALQLLCDAKRDRDQCAREAEELRARVLQLEKQPSEAPKVSAQDARDGEASQDTRMRALEEKLGDALMMLKASNERADGAEARLKGTGKMLDRMRELKARVHEAEKSVHLYRPHDRVECGDMDGMGAPLSGEDAVTDEKDPLKEYIDRCDMVALSVEATRRTKEKGRMEHEAMRMSRKASVADAELRQLRADFNALKEKHTDAIDERDEKLACLRTRLKDEKEKRRIEVESMKGRLEKNETLLRESSKRLAEAESVTLRLEERCRQQQRQMKKWYLQERIAGSPASVSMGEWTPSPSISKSSESPREPSSAPSFCSMTMSARMRCRSSPSETTPVVGRLRRPKSRESLLAQGFVEKSRTASVTPSARALD